MIKKRKNSTESFFFTKLSLLISSKIIPCLEELLKKLFKFLENLLYASENKELLNKMKGKRVSQ